MGSPARAGIDHERAKVEAIRNALGSPARAGIDPETKVF